ncbi:MAG: T9SS type A sorting domain-containing protein [Bacteroidales bacterium]|nr:T9SS type A sorting domain-containing protein [Bacteroidales bacterium]
MKKIYLFAIIYFTTFYANAQFGGPEIVDNTITSTIVNIITADLNNDGKKDIITSHYQNQINWYNNSGGTFSSEQSITESMSHPYHLDVGDANGDDFIDILATDDNGNNSKVLLFLNIAGGTSWNQVVIDSAIQVAAFKSFFADVDNDGDSDIITNTDLEITMYLNSGMGNFSSRIVIANTNEFYSITLNDFNNDDFKDFAVHSAHGLQLYLNSTDTSFFLANTIDPGLNGFLTSVDIDNDNDMDIISGTNLLLGYTTFKNDGTGVFSYFEATHYYCGDSQNAPFVNTQLNNDTFEDALYIPNTNLKLFWKQNNGSGNLLNPLSIDDTYQYLNVCADDIDNDQDNDIIWYGINSGVRYLGIIKNNNPVLGLKHEESEYILKIIPNPASRSFCIQPDINLYEINIHNTFGQLILASKDKDVNISDLTKGIYFVTVTSVENDKITLKLIKE